MLVGVYTVPVLITYLGLVSSLSSIIYLNNKEYRYMIILFMLSGIFDLFDGMLARKLNKTEKEKNFGIQIDSIIDVCSFGLVPIIIGYIIGMNSFLDYGILLMYLVCATMRLAYFNYLTLTNKDENSKRKYYQGLPVTYSTIILPIIFILTYLIYNSFELYIIRITYIILAILYIMNIKVPKPVGKWYVIFPLLTTIASIIVFFIF